MTTSCCCERIGAASLAVMAPVRAGASSGAAGGARSAEATETEGPFARVPGTHFGRFAFIPALTGARGEALESEGSFLLMCAEFDSAPATWTTLLCERTGDQLDSVMGYCEGFPGSGDPTTRLPGTSAPTTRRRASPSPDTAGSGSRRCARRCGSSEPSGSWRCGPRRRDSEGESLRAAWREAVRGSSLADVQGNVICGYGTLFARYVFARVADPGLARGLLAEMLDRVTFNESWEANPPEYTLNIAFTHAGLLALGVPAESFDGARRVHAGDGGARGGARRRRPVRARALGARPAATHMSANSPDRAGARWRSSRRRRRWRAGSVRARAVSLRGSLRRPRCSRARASTSASATASRSRRSPGQTRGRATARGR